MTREHRPLVATLVGALGLYAAGCHPTGVETVSNLDTVTTAHDSTFNFATPTKYSLANQVKVIGVPTWAPQHRPRAGADHPPLDR
jgi:hypothetical protein